jgi:hypothetical protein
MNLVSVRSIQPALWHRRAATQRESSEMPKADAAIEAWVSWLGCVTGIGGAGLLASHAPYAGWGFVCFLVSNVAWFVHGRITGSNAQVVMQIGYSITAAVGAVRWLT